MSRMIHQTNILKNIFLYLLQASLEWKYIISFYDFLNLLMHTCSIEISCCPNLAKVAPSHLTCDLRPWVFCFFFTAGLRPTPSKQSLELPVLCKISYMNLNNLKRTNYLSYHLSNEGNISICYLQA